MLTEDMGFGIVEERWTPKVAYFVLRAEDRKVGRVEKGGEKEGEEGGKEGGRQRRKASSSWAKDFDVVL